MVKAEASLSHSTNDGQKVQSSRLVYYLSLVFHLAGKEQVLPEMGMV